MRLNSVSLAALAAVVLAACTTSSEGAGDTDAACVGASCDEGRDVAAEDTVDEAPDVVEDVAVPDVADVADVVDAAPEVSDAAVDAEGSDATAVPDVVIPRSFAILTPDDGSSFDIGEPVEFLAVVEGADPTGVVVSFESDADGILGEGSGDGIDAWWLTTDSLTPGAHLITATATFPGGDELTDTVALGVCGWPAPFTFDADLDPAVWTSTGDAARDPRGWLELTGNVRSHRGGIINTVDQIAGGDVRFRFDVSTGQCNDPGPCSGNGADGFALSVYGVADPTTLPDIVTNAEYGGGLGYGLAGDYGDMEIDAFHIEFDTYYNQINGAEFHTDPTMVNHVGITLDGDPGNHVLWAELPDLEDNEWHSVEILIDGITITVLWDGVEVATGDVPGFSFKGGYIVFTGSTGYYSNYHRFDNLSIYEACSF